MNMNPADIHTLRQTLKYMENYLDETGGCDHPANICVCGIRVNLDCFGKLCWHLTDGKVGWQYLRFDVDTDDPKQRAAEEASSAAEAMGNMRDIAMTMMQEMHDFRNRQLAREDDALNSSFCKGTIND